MPPKLLSSTVIDTFDRQKSNPGSATSLFKFQSCFVESVSSRFFSFQLVTSREIASGSRVCVVTGSERDVTVPHNDERC